MNPPRSIEDGNYSDDSGSDGGPEGLIDSSSEEGFGDASPEDGIDPFDHEGDDQSPAEIAREGLHRPLPRSPTSDDSESESRSATTVAARRRQIETPVTRMTSTGSATASSHGQAPTSSSRPAANLAMCSTKVLSSRVLYRRGRPSG